MKKQENNLVWIDLEMSGLEPETDVIVEIATIITDDQLEESIEGPDIIVHQSDEILNNMNDWCKKQHAKSGLFQAVKESHFSVAQAEDLTLDFIQQYAVKDKAVMCGNSIWQDKVFIRKYMPKLYEFFFYKVIDVSTVKELLKRWYPNSPYVDFKKRDTHRALPDIRESIEQLKHYKTHFFVPEEILEGPK